jgi:RNA polymerase subunit RPABC4/transcription elongation factor Spt4
MFLIAGVSPKIKTLETAPRICPACGLAQAYLQRVDHYLSLFFIPIIRVKTGEPALICNRCRASGYDQPGVESAPPIPESIRVCKQCGRTLEGRFAFCPYCGVKSR